MRGLFQSALFFFVSIMIGVATLIIVMSLMNGLELNWKKVLELTAIL